MKITGHETQRVFDAYNIVSPADLEDAALKIAGTFAMVTPAPRSEDQHLVSL